MEKKKVIDKKEVSKESSSTQLNELKWTTKLSVGERIIDEQHQQILNQISKIQEEDEDALNITRQIIHFLDDYIKKHLSYEEKYMERNNYPALNEHKEIHKRFIDSYGQFKEKLSQELIKKGDVRQEIQKHLKEIHDFLGNWWINHIAVEDHKYCVFMGNCAKQSINKTTVPNKEDLKKQITSEKVNPTQLNEMKWTSKISVGNDIIDAQHKKLLSQVIKLVQELSNGKELEMARDTLHFLGQYIKEHFNYEESYMKENNYPNLAEHKRIHKDFIKFFKDFHQEFKISYNSKQSVTRRLRELGNKAKEFLGDWYVNHIIKEDHKYCVFMGNCAKQSIAKETISKKESSVNEDDNVKYFLKTPELKEKLIKKNVEPTEEINKDVEKKKKDQELVNQKTREEELIAEKEKLAHEYEEKLKVKLQEALENQKQTFEEQLKNDFEYREKELKNKIENERKNLNLREQKLNELHNKKQNSFIQMQNKLRQTLKAQEKIGLSKVELKKSKKDIRLPSGSYPAACCDNFKNIVIR